MSANRRERIVFLDQLERLHIFSLRGKFDITLYGNMSRAIGFTGSGSIFVNLIPVKTELRVPSFLVQHPHMVVGRLGFFFRDRGLRTQFSPQMECIHLTVFHTLAAGCTLIHIYLGNIVRSVEIW